MPSLPLCTHYSLLLPSHLSYSPAPHKTYLGHTLIKRYCPLHPVCASYTLCSFKAVLTLNRNYLQICLSKGKTNGSIPFCTLSAHPAQGHRRLQKFGWKLDCPP